MFIEFIVFVATLIVLVVSIKVKKLLQVPPTPLLKSEWWGPGTPTTVDTPVRPFEIEISKNIIDDLHQRLNNARFFTPPLDGIQHQYGMNTKLLSDIVEFWKTKYDWRERQAFLNQYPQFKINVQGLDIHFLQVKPTSTDGLKVVPLLLIHGWPGSVREFYELIPLLTRPQSGKDFIFEVIVPSLPGFGFSDGTARQGLCPFNMAVIFKDLMKRLAFDKYYVQGGDWGALIATTMVTLFPDQVQGVHMNFRATLIPLPNTKMLIRKYLPPVLRSEDSKDAEIRERLERFLAKESGYSRIQSTKPDTLGAGLNDSPVGLAAYIIEKFSTWTNPSWINRLDGGLLEKYTFTKLLDNIMIYWVTNSITTSMRIYYERAVKEDLKLLLDKIPVNRPVAYNKFKHELWHVPEEALRQKYLNLVHFVDIPDGGHFAALEVPDVLAKDIWEAFTKFLDFYKNMY